jgi:hypothetical protein
LIFEQRNMKSKKTIKNATPIAIGNSIVAMASSLLLRREIDPYTRLATGTALALTTTIGLAARYDPFTSFVIGFGMIVGSGIVSGIDIARQSIPNIRHNNYPAELYYIYESGEGVFPVGIGKQPPHGIDGFTYKGANRVFKVRDGVYVDIDQRGNVAETSILGRYVNQKGGWKDKKWCELLSGQGDTRWLELYKHSMSDT